MGFSAYSDTTDQEGHDTHVAGTAASSIYGVASNANLIGVKVLGADGGGTTEDCLDGIDYVIATHEVRRVQPGFVGSVMSMSWNVEAQYAATVLSAVSAAVDRGIHASSAAGNQGENACSQAPAAIGGNVTGAITVGSIGPSGAISSFSNTGPCVDIYAPGEDVLSSYIGSPGATQVMSGTSMSTPHVTGIIAYLMASNRYLAGNPSALKARLKAMAASNVVYGPTVPGDLRLLLSNGVRTPGKRQVARHSMKY